MYLITVYNQCHGINERYAFKELSSELTAISKFCVCIQHEPVAAVAASAANSSRTLFMCMRIFNKECDM